MDIHAISDSVGCWRHLHKAARYDKGNIGELLSSSLVAGGKERESSLSQIIRNADV